MITLVRARVLRLLKIDFIRFCIVGGLGFVINLALLLFFQKALNLPIFLAQLFGSEIALFCNFILHHNWTYKANRVKKTIPQLLLQFHATSWPAIIGSAAMVDAGVRWVHLDTTVALVISSGIALIWNFAWSKYVIWRDTTNDKVEELVS